VNISADWLRLYHHGNLKFLHSKKNLKIIYHFKVNDDSTGKSFDIENFIDMERKWKMPRSLSIKFEAMQTTCCRRIKTFTLIITLQIAKIYDVHVNVTIILRDLHIINHGEWIEFKSNIWFLHFTKFKDNLISINLETRNWIKKIVSIWNCYSRLSTKRMFIDSEKLLLTFCIRLKISTLKFIEFLSRSTWWDISTLNHIASHFF
jgi:hypothetical protein